MWRILAALGWLIAVTPASAANRIAIHDVTLLDGRGGAPVRNATVLVKGERIEAILTKRSRLPKGVRVISGRGRYLLPGFIDMHAHLLVPRCEAPAGQASPFDRNLSERMLSTLLDFGITSVRSASPFPGCHAGLSPL